MGNTAGAMVYDCEKLLESIKAKLEKELAM